MPPRPRRRLPRPRLVAGVLLGAALAVFAAAAILQFGFPGDDDEAPPAAPSSPSAEPEPTATPEPPAGVRRVVGALAATNEDLPDPPTPTPEPDRRASAASAGDSGPGPARMRIPRFNVDAAMERIGLVPGRNQLDSPHDPHRVGWYHIYDRPGAPGNAVFSAHVDYYPNIRGPFNRLDEVNVGDEVVVRMDDGSEYTYEVIENTRYHVNDIPMGDIIRPPNRPAGEEWITLITCGGDFRPYNGSSGPGQYLHRDVVVARRTG